MIRPVRNGSLRRIEGRNEGLQDLFGLRHPGCLQLFRRQHVNRHRRFDDRSARPSCTEHDNFIDSEQIRRQKEVDIEALVG